MHTILFHQTNKTCGSHNGELCFGDGQRLHVGDSIDKDFSGKNR